MESRELFWSLESNDIIIFYIFGYSSIAVFIWGCWRHFSKYRRGTPTVIPLNLLSGIKTMLVDVLSHRTVIRRDRYAGLAHSGLFFGFVIAAVGTAIITLEYDILEPLFGIKFWQGRFYLWYSLVLDLGHLALVIGIVMMMLRRLFFALPKLNYLRSYTGETELSQKARQWRIEDWAFLTVLLLIELSGFLQEGVRIVMEQADWSAWSPIGFYSAKLFVALGMAPEQALAIRAANWWIHGLLALAFTAAIPWYKTKHILAVLGSLALKDEKALKRLPKANAEKDIVGICNITDFSWKDMLNLDACTKCGRCHEACPATASGYNLSPRDLILDLRTENDNSQKSNTSVDLVSEVISPETLWACRSCGACQEICPVGIEHPTMIVEMRRQLVERGHMDPMLQKTLVTIGDTGNSFGKNMRERSTWTRQLDFKIKDIRQEAADVLWFVGDYASFDPRNQEISRVVARLLKAADVDFALLHEGERTAGNDVRRVGEEGLFESLVEHNLEQMTGCKPFNKIITTDPHSYNTLKNEYPEFGDVAPVEHYSSTLAALMVSGRLEVVKPLKKRVTFHDPCHLGRLNNSYDAPRDVIKLTGCELLEMPRNRDNSFCCGAGGGRIWIPDDSNTEKPSENRMHEAAALPSLDFFITSCPKDLTMFEDARKTSGHEKDFLVQDIAELIAEAVDLNNLAVFNSAFDVEPVQGTSLRDTPEIIDDTPKKEAVFPATDQLEAMDWDNLRPKQAAVFEDYPDHEKAGLRILVAIKHAAVLGDNYEFAGDNKDVASEYLSYEFSEWDDAALEEALLIKDKRDDVEVVAVTVGSELAEDTLLKVLAKGADRGVRVWHDCLIAADPISIAQALAGVAKRENPDLILTGAQSADFSHGATGIAMSRMLAMPHVAIITALDWYEESKIRVVRELEGGILHTMEMNTPAVLTMQTGTNAPRFATMRMIKKAKLKPLLSVDAASMNENNDAYVVRRMYAPDVSKAQMLEGSANEIADKILDIVRDKHGE